MNFSLPSTQCLKLPSVIKNGGVVYGGSLNPMQPGHQLKIMEASEYYSPVVVGLSPLPNSSKKLAPPHLRLELIRLMLETLSPAIRTNIHLLTAEECQNYTAYLTAVRQYLNCPTGKVNFMIGSDNVSKILDPPLKILKDFKPIVFERAGFPLDRDATLQLANQASTEIELYPSSETQQLSSTKIRGWMIEWNVYELLKLYPSHILDFLKEHLKEFTQF
jgi:nicotinic acid mononucleotide adenylyltransferase